jgi:exodeoxyribonuclease VII small subunit
MDGKTKKKESEESFENSLKRLEQIAQEMESDDLDLDKSLSLFNEGMGIIKICSQKLTETKKKIEILLEDGGKKDFKG